MPGCPTDVAEQPPAELSPGSRLCTSCGLCCTGAIHNNAVLDEDEIASARKLGLPVLDGDRPLFALPCPKLRDDCCTIYGQRPRVCGRYRCQLLQDLDSGAVELAPALRRVVEAKALLRQLREAMPLGMSLQESRRIALGVRPDDADSRQMLIVKLRSTAFQHYLDKHFRNSKESKLFEITTMTDGDLGMDKS